MGTALTVIFYALIMVLVFGVLIFIHEFGHFFTARRCGVAVKEFAIGMGPKIFSWKSKKYDTQYALRAFPIGGFVSMVGEDEESDSEDAFCNKSVFKRMLIVVAGAVMNLLLGFLLMMAVVLMQGPIGSTVVAEFNENAISNAQLQVGDEIISVAGTKVYSGNEVIYEIMNKGYEPIDLVVKRNGEKVTLNNVVFSTVEEDGVTFGYMDFKVLREARTFSNLMKQTFFRSVSSVKMVYDSLVGLVSGRFGVDAVSGPIGVTEVVGSAASEIFGEKEEVVLAIAKFLYIVSILTINLGVMNLLPFPALDGGRFVMLAIEGIRRKPFNRNVEAYINFVGIIVLFAFMIFVSFKDVLKLIFR